MVRLRSALLPYQADYFDFGGFAPQD
jgi:hypothetical protein